MGLELVIFIIAILFGIFLYWRESNGNGAYRRLNKIVNSKELQMSPDNPKGFIYKQSIIPRIIFIVSLVLLTGLIIQFVTPLPVFTDYNAISALASFTVGTLLGTYLASFVIKSSEVIEEKSDSISDMVGDVVDKGKDLIEDLTSKHKEDASVTSSEVEKSQIKTSSNENSEVEEKSARERLKDKGLM